MITKEAFEKLDEVLNKVNNIEEEIITELVEEAFNNGRISSEEKGTYQRMAKSNFADTKLILQNMKGHRSSHISIGEMIADLKKSNRANTEELSEALLAKNKVD